MLFFILNKNVLHLEDNHYHTTGVSLSVFSIVLTDIHDIQIDDSWKTILADQFAKTYFTHIKEFLLQEKQVGHIVYPK